MVTFQYKLTVNPQDIDSLKHVNNEVYLRWLVQAAGAHSESLGYGMQRFLTDGAAFVVRRHELDYLASAYLNDELVIETWVNFIKGAKSERQYKLIRSKDNKVLMEAKTLWVYIDLTTGKPKEIPQQMHKDYMPHED